MHAGDLNQQVVLRYSFSGPEYFTVAGPLRIMPQIVSLDVSLAAKDQRRYPKDLEVLDSKEMILEIELPENLSLKYLPEDISEESPWASFNARYSYQDNKISFSQDMQLNKRVVLKEEYQEFKDFFERLAKKIKQRVVLEQR